MQEKNKIQSMFDNIAPEYDKLNHLLSLDIDKRWRRKAVKKILDVSKDVQVLDIACGTGDFSIEIAEKLKAKPNITGHITGVDISSGMLNVMKEKVQKKNLNDLISINLGDGEKLDFTDESFDRVCIAFGIRNFEDRAKGLKEMLRVLKKGGRLVILELSLPSSKIIQALFKFYFTKILPIIGGNISGDKTAYKYLPDSVIDFPQKKEWIKFMEDCGFQKVKHKALTFGICRMYIGEK